MQFMKMIVNLMFTCLLHQAVAQLDLTGSEYALMPPIFHLDKYEQCLFENNASGVYCHTKFDVVVDQPSRLYDLMVAYSERTESHFNHTQLSYGICLTRTCKKFYQGNARADQTSALEACLNETLWQEHNLKARVTNRVTCDTAHDKFNIETEDICVLMLVFVLVLLNFIGSIQDFIFERDNKKNANNSFLSCFSIRRNWRKLTARAADGPEPRLVRLRGFYGLKSLSVMLVIMCHSMLPFVVDADNTHFFEDAYKKWYYQILANGTYIVQTFFVMSGFLLAYNLQLYSETHTVTWIIIPKSIFIRWVRLSAPYIFILLVTTTWLRGFGSGPLWQSVVLSEVESCRRDWWLNLLYVNNYVDYSYCMLHTWYIAADFQLHILGGIVLALFSGRQRKVVLIAFFVIGLVLPVAHTYFQHLDGAMWISPETSRNFFISNPTFNHTYKRGHTNLASFILGLATGLAVYRWQSQGYKFNKCVSHRFLVWLMVPAGIAVVLLGAALYPEGHRISVFIRAPYAGVMKPLFGAIIAYLIIAMVFKFEGWCRGVLEWAGWVVPSRVSYCAYLVHVMLVRLLTGARTTLVHVSFLHLCEILTSSIVISFVAALPLHLLVEAPCNQIVKQYLMGPRKADKSKEKIDNDMKNEKSNAVSKNNDSVLSKDEKTDSNKNSCNERSSVEGQI